MVINAIVSIIAIMALGFLGWHNTNHGIDGTIMLLIVGAISGIAGYNVSKILSIIKNNKQ